MADQQRPTDTAAGRLVGWKAIGRHIGRDARTAQRWAQERGLPVQYAPGGERRTVFADPARIDAWLAQTPPEAPAEAADAAENPLPIAAVVAPTRRRVWPVLLIAGAVAALVGGMLWLGGGAAPPDPRPVAQRAHATALPADPVAHDLYLSGMYHWSKRTPADLAAAQDDFTRAIVAAPTYAPAYAGLANVYNLQREYAGLPDSIAYPRAKAAAERAIALDPGLASAHAALAFVTFYWTQDFPRGLSEFETAIRLDPDNATTHHWYANALTAQGDWRRGLAEISRAAALDPASTAIASNKALIEWRLGQHDSARARLLDLAAADPRSASPLGVLADIALADRDSAAYLDAAARAATLTEDKVELSRVAAARRAYARAKGDRHAALLTALRDFDAARAATADHGWYLLARSEARLNNVAGARAALAKARAARDPWVMYLKSERELATFG